MVKSIQDMEREEKEKKEELKKLQDELKKARKKVKDLDTLKRTLDEKYAELEKTIKGTSAYDKLISEIADLEVKISEGDKELGNKPFKYQDFEVKKQDSPSVVDGKDVKEKTNEQKLEEVAYKLTIADRLEEKAKLEKTTSMTAGLKIASAKALKAEVFESYKSLINVDLDENVTAEDIDMDQMMSLFGVSKVTKQALEKLPEERRKEIAKDIKGTIEKSTNETLLNRLDKAREVQIANKANKEVAIEQDTIEKMKISVVDYEMDQFEALGIDMSDYKDGRIKLDIGKEEIKTKNHHDYRVTYKNAKEKDLKEVNEKPEVAPMTKGLDKAKSYEEARNIIYKNARSYIKTFETDNKIEDIQKQIERHNEFVHTDEELRQMSVKNRLKALKEERKFYRGLRKEGIKSKEEYQKKMEEISLMADEYNKAYDIVEQADKMKNIYKTVDSVKSMKDIIEKRDELVGLGVMGKDVEFRSDLRRNKDGAFDGISIYPSGIVIPKQALATLATNGFKVKTVKEQVEFEEDGKTVIKENEIKTLASDDKELLSGDVMCIETNAIEDIVDGAIGLQEDNDKAFKEQMDKIDKYESIGHVYVDLETQSLESLFHIELEEEKQVDANQEITAEEETQVGTPEAEQIDEEDLDI